MGQRGPVQADLRVVVCGTRKCLAVPLSVSESRRRQVMLSCFTALFPYPAIYTVWVEQEELLPNYIQICWKSLEGLGIHPYVHIYISFAGMI